MGGLLSNVPAGQASDSIAQFLAAQMLALGLEARCGNCLRLEWFDRLLKALAEKPVAPTPIVVVCPPMFDAGCGKLKAIARNGLQRVPGADAFATERFGQSRQPVRDRQRRS